MRKELVLLSLNLVVSGAIIIGLLLISFPNMTVGGPEPFTNGDFEIKVIFAVGLPIWLMVKVDALIRTKSTIHESWKPLMKQNVRKKALFFVNWLAGLCAVAGVIASLRGLYGMFQVWTGKITSVPFIGELAYPGDVESGTGMLLSFFEVGLGGMAYAFIWVIPAGIGLLVLTFVSGKLNSTRPAPLEPVTGSRG